MWHQVFQKANEVYELTQCQKFSSHHRMYANHGHLCKALEASSHQIVWLGVQIFAYPLEAILELFNDLWHAHNHWCIWPGYLLAVWGHEGDLMGTKPCGSISGGWSLFQQFLGCKLVMGLSTEGIPINIFEIVPYIPHKSGVTQYIGWIILVLVNLLASANKKILPDNIILVLANKWNFLVDECTMDFFGVGEGTTRF